jgi:S1-C subfamily serine protease
MIKIFRVLIGVIFIFELCFSEKVDESVEKVYESVKSSVLLAKIEKKSTQEERPHPGIFFIGGPPEAPQREQQIQAIILDKEGKVLVPGFYKRKDIENAKVYIGDKEYTCSLISSMQHPQLSIFKIEEKTLTLNPISFTDSDKVRIGQSIIIIESKGASENYEKFLDVGIIKGKFVGNMYTQFEVSCNKLPGSAIFDLSGKVIGIVMHDRSIAASNDVKKFINELLEKAHEKEKFEERRPIIGILHTILSPSYAEAIGIQKEGVKVEKVFKDSPAEKAGLKDDDIIISVDGKKIKSTMQNAINEFMNLLKPEEGKSRELEIIRGKEKKKITVKFEEETLPKIFTSDELGLTVSEIRDQEYFTKNLTTREGVLITEVIQGGAASMAEVRRDSVIVAMNGKEIKNITDFIREEAKVKEKKLSAVLLKLRSGILTEYKAINLSIGKYKK